MRLLAYFAIGLLWSAALFGCNTTPSTQIPVRKPAPDLIPGIRLLQDDSEWEKQVREHIHWKILEPYSREGFTYHRYHWLLGSDTMVKVDVRFNGGGHYNHGPLKSIYMDLATSRDKAVKPDDVSPVRIEDGILKINRYCSIRSFEKIKGYMDRNYGQPSATEEKDDEITYSYDMGDYIVYLGWSSKSEPSNGIDVPHYYNAFLHASMKTELDLMP